MSDLTLDANTDEIQKAMLPVKYGDKLFRMIESARAAMDDEGFYSFIRMAKELIDSQ